MVCESYVLWGAVVGRYLSLGLLAATGVLISIAKRSITNYLGTLIWAWSVLLPQLDNLKNAHVTNPSDRWVDIF